MVISIKRQIIITGGLGFIGHHLTKILIAKDYFPVIVDNLSNGSITILDDIPKDRYCFIRCDIRNFKALKKKLAPFRSSTIIHLAAVHFIPYCNRHPREVLAVNLRGTENLLKISNCLGIKKFLFASTAAVYAPDKQSHSENSRLGPIDIYGLSKKLAEEAIIEQAKYNTDLKFTILRLFNVYGPEDATPHFIPEMIRKIKNEAITMVGNLNTTRDYIYINDVAKAFLKVLRSEKKLANFIYNIGTGKGINGFKTIKLIAQFLEKSPTIIKDSSLLREVDRKKSVANIKKFSKAYSWLPKYNIESGLKRLCKN